MGHVLSFTHCKDAPSTASSTPDSCSPDEVYPSDSAHPALADQYDGEDAAVTLADLWPLPSPQEPTFSYITIGSSVPTARPPARARRGRGLTRGPGPRREEPAHDVVSYVLLEKMCHMTQSLPPIRCHEEKTERPRARVNIHPAVMDLLYWKNVALSAGSLTGLTVSLLCLIQFSVISVVSYAALLLLCGCLTVRAYAALLHGLKRGDGGNPFQKYLDLEPLPAQQVEAVAARLAVLFFSALSALRGLFLVKDTKESLKFLVLLYLLTYVGAVLNGLTALLLGVIGLFTFPVIYKHNQVLVDRYVSAISSRISAFRAKFRAQLKKQGTKKD